jgi:hypothetical protein
MLRSRILELQYNSLLNPKFTRRTIAIAFADELILAISSEKVSEAENCSNLELNKITAWSKSNKISFNEEKCKVMLTSRRKRRELKEINVYLNNKPLKQVTTVKYLGIIIDNKFKFGGHVSCAAERCTKVIHSLSKSANISWGQKHSALRTTYREAILPLLLYGAPVWKEAMKYVYF